MTRRPEHRRSHSSSSSVRPTARRRVNKPAAKPTVAPEESNEQVAPESLRDRWLRTKTDAQAITLPPPAVERRPARTTRPRTTAQLFGDYRYVWRDLRRIALLVIVFLVLLMLLNFAIMPHLSF